MNIPDGLSVSFWDDPASNHALFYTPEITWKGIDNLELGLGASFFEGRGDKIFAGLRDYNMLSVSAKINF